MNQKLSIPGWSLLFLLMVNASCKHDPITPLDEAPAISFKSDIQPVLVANCTQSGCHGTESPTSAVLITYQDIAGQTDPGNARKSNLYKALTATSGDLLDAHSDHKLSDPKIKQIYLWITQGSNNN